MRVLTLIIVCLLKSVVSRDEAKILKACFWPNEVYEPCFGGCAEVSCDNPRNHLRPCYPYCEPGCVCEDPYVRDDRTHQCVLPQDCSPTQMGIPVPSRRNTNTKLGAPKYEKRAPRMIPHLQTKRSDLLSPPVEMNELPNDLPPSSRIDDFKRPSEVARMGNYFNIVIAPPPIKTLQPRKMISTQNEVFRSPKSPGIKQF